MKQGILTVLVWLVLTGFVFGQSPATPQAPAGNTSATTKESTELLATISRLDSQLFEAFNTRNLEVIKTMFAKDVEFYHDTGGVANYDQTMESFKNLFEQSKTNGLRRDLVKGSLEVYPIKDFGAIQVGQHRFCHKENGRDDCGTFKFVHVWRFKDGEWKISRVVSYGH
jgi:hypothetical protein